MSLSRSPEFIHLHLSFPFVSLLYPLPPAARSVCRSCVFFPYSTLVRPILLPLLPPGVFLTNRWISVEFSRSDDFNLSTGRKKSGTHSDRGGPPPPPSPRLVSGVSVASSTLFLFLLSLSSSASLSTHYSPSSPSLLSSFIVLPSRSPRWWKIELVTRELSCLVEGLPMEVDLVRLFRHGRNSLSI